jgi:hypothetical protein
MIRGFLQKLTTSTKGVDEELDYSAKQCSRDYRARLYHHIISLRHGGRPVEEGLRHVTVLTAALAGPGRLAVLAPIPLLQMVLVNDVRSGLLDSVIEQQRFESRSVTYYGRWRGGARFHNLRSITDAFC